MSIKTMFADWLLPVLQERQYEPSANVVVPPAREAASNDPLNMSTIFRAVQILQTAISGLPIKQLRNGRETEVASIVLKPCLEQTRADFISEIVACLALHGNAYIYKQTTRTGQIVNLRVVPPQYVNVTNDSDNILKPNIKYYIGNNVYTDKNIIHLKFMNVAGQLLGVGPVQAARPEIHGAMQARDYKARWFDDSLQPTGILSTSERLSQELAEEMKSRFDGSRHGVKVLGSGLAYTPLDLSPADMQYLETIKFDTVQIARLFGIPSSLMLASVDGSNLTYSNIEQEWIQFADYTLAAYTQDIADALTQLVPRGNQIVFDWDGMRRSDTLTRLRAYQIAIQENVMTVDEVRAKEGLPPVEKASNDTAE